MTEYCCEQLRDFDVDYDGNRAVFTDDYGKWLFDFCPFCGKKLSK